VFESEVLIKPCQPIRMKEEGSLGYYIMENLVICVANQAGFAKVTT
jgi:hypothetical protein